MSTYVYNNALMFSFQEAPRYGRMQAYPSFQKKDLRFFGTTHLLMLIQTSIRSIQLVLCSMGISGSETNGWATMLNGIN